MKVITLDEFKNVFLNKFKNEETFKKWWFKERKKVISDSYPNKEIMKLPVDQHKIYPKLLKQLKLVDTKIIETEDYPTPKLTVENYIRSYKMLFK